LAALDRLGTQVDEVRCMTTQRLLRATGLAALAAAALPFGPEAGSAAEPDVDLAPASAALDTERAFPHAEQQSRVVLQHPAGPAGDVRRSFVVLTRADGRVPRAWLWDEPLGCPGDRH